MSRKALIRPAPQKTFFVLYQMTAAFFSTGPASLHILSDRPSRLASINRMRQWSIPRRQL